MRKREQMRFKYFYALVAVTIVLFSSCEIEHPQPLTKGERPSPIKNYSVENVAGGAIITFSIPDNNTLYVLAEYQIRDGVKREARSSKFGNELVIDGFGKEGQYEVTIFAVGKGEQRSEPVVVTVNPSRPAYLLALETVQVSPDYGGCRVDITNVGGQTLMVGVITTDSLGRWYSAKYFSSESRDISITVRGFLAEKRKFGVYIRDQWQNFSDTLIAEIEPFEEVPVDMSKFKETNFPGDAPALASYPVKNLFDGRKGNWGLGYYSQNVGIPQHITFALPEVFVLSRFKMWMNMDLPYNSTQPKYFKIWGSLAPNPNGSLDSTWYLLAEYDNWKPSGLPTGQTTQEDIDQAAAGNEFTFPLNSPPAKYIRFQTIETWTPSNHVYITELALWGRTP